MAAYSFDDFILIISRYTFLIAGIMVLRLHQTPKPADITDISEIINTIQLVAQKNYVLLVCREPVIGHQNVLTTQRWHAVHIGKTIL